MNLPAINELVKFYEDISLLRQKETPSESVGKFIWKISEVMHEINRVDGINEHRTPSQVKEELSDEYRTHLLSLITLVLGAIEDYDIRQKEIKEQESSSDGIDE